MPNHLVNRSAELQAALEHQTRANEGDLQRTANEIVGILGILYSHEKVVEAFIDALELGQDVVRLAKDQGARTLRYLGGVVLLLDIAIVVGLLLLDAKSYRPPPQSGTDTGATIGWLGTIGAIVAFGNYGVLIKTPAVAEAKVDTMVFQVYLSTGVVLCSLLIFALTIPKSVAFTWLGFAFGGIWLTCQLAAYNAIQHLGYAVGPGMWCGLTILVSFFWGSVIFGDKVESPGGAAAALILLTVGICGCAASTSSFPGRVKAWVEGGYTSVNQYEDCETHEGGPHDGKRSRSNSTCSVMTPTPALQDGTVANLSTASRLAKGFVYVLITGVANGSLMFPSRCYLKGCPVIHVPTFTTTETGLHGDANIAFLPSMCAGIVALTPVYFFLYFRAPGVLSPFPNMHVKVAAIPGVLTGVYWACGNFASFFATTYLGQTIGFPLTQCCMVLNGLWGILYYGEITGAYPVGLFCVSVAVIIGGAVLDGRYG
eukprot:Sspe_Gene.12989::Locus_4449_Transcript_1_1_Confidence_1.000_Length_1659::g.12989::m.12989